MSGSQRAKNDALTPRQIEEEQMIQELMNVQIYEEGMTYKQMKDILGVLKESKSMANMDPEETDSQQEPQSPRSPSPEMVSQTTSNVNQRTINVKKTRTPTPSFSCLNNSMSSKAFDRNANGGQASSSAFPERSPEQLRNEEEEVIFDGSYEATNSKDEPPQDHPQLRNQLSKGSSSESQSSQSAEVRKKRRPTKHHQKVDRWRLDPLNVSADETDVPLAQPNRSLARERIPLSLCNAKRTLETQDRVMIEVSKHLEEVAAMWHNLHKTPADAEFQWGAPIQVGSANGSLDRKPLKQTKQPLLEIERRGEETSERANSADSSSERKNAKQNAAIEGRSRQMLDRASKRKLNKMVLLSSESDESEAEESTVVAKKKKPRASTDRNNAVATKVPERSSEQTKSLYWPDASDNQDIPIESNDNSDDLGDIYVQNLYVKDGKKKVLEDWIYSYQHPRCIVPSNPVKKYRNTKKGQNKNERDSASAGVSRNASVSSTADEKDAKGDREGLTRLKDNEDTEGQSDVVEIKPLKCTGLRKKLPRSCLRLKRVDENVKKGEQERLTEQEKEREDAGSEVDQSRRDSVEDAETGRRDQRTGNNRNRRGSPKKNSRSRETGKMTTEREEANRRRHLNEDEAPEDVDEVQVIEKSSNTVGSLGSQECPVCRKNFPRELLQDHAWQCGSQTDIENGSCDSNEDAVNVAKKAPTEILRCEICSAFSTDSGIEFEDHTHLCLRRRAQKSDDNRRSVFLNTAHVESPPSPKVYSVPSSQTDTDVDYVGQFPQRNNSQRTYSGKKRKR